MSTPNTTGTITGDLERFGDRRRAKSGTPFPLAIIAGLKKIFVILIGVIVIAQGIYAFGWLLISMRLAYSDVNPPANVWIMSAGYEPYLFTIGTVGLAGVALAVFAIMCIAFLGGWRP